MLFEKKVKPEMTEYLRSLGFKSLPPVRERKEISKETLDRLRNIPEYKPLVEKLERGMLGLDVVEEPKSIDEEITSVYVEGQSEPLKVIPLPEVEPVKKILPEKPVITPMKPFTSVKATTETKKDITMIEITKELRDTLKHIKGKRTYDELIREQLGI